MNKKTGAMFLGILLTLGVLGLTHKVFAHCDTLDGPVVQDAQIALDKGDITPVLKWIKKDAEPEVREAFQPALTERKAQKLKSRSIRNSLRRSFVFIGPVRALILPG